MLLLKSKTAQYLSCILSHIHHNTVQCTVLSCAELYCTVACTDLVLVEDARLWFHFEVRLWAPDHEICVLPYCNLTLRKCSSKGKKSGRVACNSTASNSECKRKKEERTVQYSTIEYTVVMAC